MSATASGLSARHRGRCGAGGRDPWILPDGHPPLVMRAGSYAWGPPRVPHSARCANQGTCYLFVAFVDLPDGFPVGDR